MIQLQCMRTVCSLEKLNKSTEQIDRCERESYMQREESLVAAAVLSFSIFSSERQNILYLKVMRMSALLTFHPLFLNCKSVRSKSN